MKLIKLEFSDGFKTSFAVYGELISLTMENNGLSPVEEEVKKLEQTQQVTLGLFAGLWLTDRGLFVLIDEKNEGRIINERGEAFLLTNFDKDGYSADAGKLVNKKRGDEEYVDKLNFVRWPLVKENVQ